MTDKTLTELDAKLSAAFEAAELACEIAHEAAEAACEAAEDVCGAACADAGDARYEALDDYYRALKAPEKDQ